MQPEHSTPSKKSVHWTVTTNYGLRVGSFISMFISVSLHGWDKGYSPVLWGLIVLQLLVYPHLAYRRARRAPNSQQAEISNLTVDCLMFGMLVAALQFPLWITFTVYIASSLNITISRGAKGFVRSQLAFFGGAVLVVALWGWQLSPQTGWPATVMCVIGNAVYMTAIGIAAYRRNQQLRETREALRQRSTELSSTLAQLQQSQKDLLEAEKLAALGSLVTGVAHELNTPIGNALLTATAMQEESHSMVQQFTAGTMKRSELEAFLNRCNNMSDVIVRSCERAVQLIDSFKAVAVDQASQKQGVFDLRAVVDDSLLTVAHVFKSPHVEMRNRVPASIGCDSYATSLTQVVASLLHNALVHAFDKDAAGVVTIEAHADATHAKLTISDNGKGMSPDVLKRVFDPFFTTRLGQGGNGLGLTICRNIVTGVLGGTLHVQSTLGQGSVFTIEFPLQASHPASARLG